MGPLSVDLKSSIAALNTDASKAQQELSAAQAALAQEQQEANRLRGLLQAAQEREAQLDSDLDGLRRRLEDVTREARGWEDEAAAAARRCGSAGDREKELQVCLSARGYRDRVRPAAPNDSPRAHAAVP